MRKLLASVDLTADGHRRKKHATTSGKLVPALRHFSGICAGSHPLHIGSLSRPFTQASSHRAR